MAKHLLQSNGTIATEWYDSPDGEVTVRHWQDAQPIMDDAQRLRGLQNPKAQMRHVAQIPATMHFQWRKEWKKTYSKDWSWDTFLAMKLNDRNFGKFRTWEGRV